MTTGEYLIEWLDGMCSILQRSTYESLTVYLHKHIIPALGDIPLASLRTRDIQKYLTEKSQCGRLDRKAGGLSPVSLKKHLSVLRQALDDAVRADYIQSNPARYARVRRTPVLSSRIRFLSLAEAKAIISALHDPVYRAIFIITLYYGLRRSELLGLRWSAIDFDKNTLTISHTVVKNLTIERKDTTKTESSRRTYQLLPEVRALIEQIPRQGDYLFNIRPDTLTRGFQRQLRKAGFPPMRFHDIRHSTASILFEAGWNLEDIKSWLGHADIETTSNIYLHYAAQHNILLSAKIAGLLID